MPSASRHHRGRRTAGLLAALVGAAAVALVAGVGRPEPAAGPREVEWGATFSSKMCDRLGVDSRQALSAVVRDLRPSALRLIAYWDVVEPQRGRYDFRELDWQVREAENARIPLVLAVGQKVPRWPEYHLPSWLRVGNQRDREEQLLLYLAEVVERYRDRPALRYWQVENEPFLDFGQGPRPNAALLTREIDLVRRLDPRHPVLVTDGGEWGWWVGTAGRGDVFGTTLYRSVYDPRLGTFSYPLPPEYYDVKERLTKLATGKSRQPFICAELGAEPWGSRPVPDMSSAEQARLFPPEALRGTVEYARRTRFREFYFWGVEWWYARKLHGDPSYWLEAKRVIRGGREPIAMW